MNQEENQKKIIIFSLFFFSRSNLTKKIIWKEKRNCIHRRLHESLYANKTERDEKVISVWGRIWACVCLRVRAHFCALKVFDAYNFWWTLDLDQSVLAFKISETAIVNYVSLHPIRNTRTTERAFQFQHLSGNSFLVGNTLDSLFQPHIK